MVTKFKNEHTVEQRKAEAERIRAKYPDRIPVICEKTEKSNVQDIDKKKYLVPADLTCGQFVYVIRKRLKLPAEQAIFLFVNGVIPPTAALMSTVHEEHKDIDGFLYVSYSGENTFGNWFRNDGQLDWVLLFSDLDRKSCHHIFLTTWSWNLNVISLNHIPEIHILIFFLCHMCTAFTLLVALLISSFFPSWWVIFLYVFFSNSACYE